MFPSFDNINAVSPPEFNLLIDTVVKLFDAGGTEFVTKILFTTNITMENTFGADTFQNLIDHDVATYG